jgi:hypothetical protein
MSTTEAGRALVAWMDSDMRPLTEFGFETIADAVEAIEAEAQARPVHIVIRRDCQDIMAVHASPAEAEADAELRMSDGSIGRYRVETWVALREEPRLADLAVRRRAGGGSGAMKPNDYGPAIVPRRGLR